jgi:hypothetical protein
MKARNDIKTILFCSALVVAAVISRVINAEMHWYNFGPLVAISLFSGTVLKNKTLACLVPLTAYFASDICLQILAHNGFYGISQFFVYGGMLLVVLLGGQMHRPKALKIMGYTVAGSLLFWIISNFGVFAAGFYGYSLSSLGYTYLMAIPFYTHAGTSLFIHQFAGDLIFSSLLFGAYALAQNLVFQKETAIH